MPSWKAFIVSVPVALAGGWAIADAGVRLDGLRREMSELEAAGRAEGESYLKTLQGSHAEKQLEHFDRRRKLALEEARARRDAMLGFLAIVAAALLFAGVDIVRRIGSEVTAERNRGRGDGTGAG